MSGPAEAAVGVRVHRILAATDGSSHGEHAAAFGRAFALGAGGVFMPLAVNSGLPGVEIVRHAETWGADVVVLGRHQRSPDRPRPLGRTSDAVIRRRSGLSLFVPPEVHFIRRATLALDGSLRGLGVVAPAGAFLNEVKAWAGAICVLPEAEAEGTDAAASLDARIERASSLVSELRLDSGPCGLLVRRGVPVPEILLMIHETGSDLLVLGVRLGGRRGDSGSGYVGRELLRSAPCAVLTVPI